MATTITQDFDPNAAKIWSKTLSVEVSNYTDIKPLIGKDSNSIIQLQDVAQKQAGDTITYSLATELLGSGVSEGETLEGNEEAMCLLSDSLRINELRHATRMRAIGTIDRQRLAFDIQNPAMQQLISWYGKRLSLMAFVQLCGYTSPLMFINGREIRLSLADKGNNEVLEPSKYNIIRPNNKNSDNELKENDKFDLRLIDEAVLRAKTMNIKPIRLEGKDVYVMYLHPSQIKDMRTNTDTGQWLDIQKAVSYSNKNPIFDGSMGLYNGVVLRESNYITNGIDATTNGYIENTRRAVLLGAQAAIIGYGRSGGANRYTTKTEYFDYEHEVGIAISTLIGFKKTRFMLPNSKFGMKDFGAMVISTYADSGLPKTK